MSGDTDSGLLSGCSASRRSAALRWRLRRTQASVHWRSSVLHPSRPPLVAAVLVAEYAGAERLGARERILRVVAVDICGDQAVGQ